MKIKYKIYPERNLLVDVSIGDIQLSDLQDISLIEMNDKQFPVVKRILSNIVDANLNVSALEVESFVSFLANPDKDTSFRWAILTDNPQQTALSFIIKFDPAFADIVGVFSTLHGCVEFLGVPFNDEEFQDSDYIKAISLNN